MNPSQRGRLGAHTMHARGLTNTAPGTRAFNRRFELEVDPEGTLPPDELEKRVKHARSVYFARLAHKRWAEKRNAEDDIASGNVWPYEVED